LNETSLHVVHLAFKICDDEDSGMDGGFYVIDASGTSISDLTGPEDTRTPENVKACKAFFQKILEALGNQNFDVDSVIANNEERIAGLVKNSDSRDKLYALIDTIVRPIRECQIPMRELRTTLIKKYLKQYLIKQINPVMPSFTPQSYQVLQHPEMFMMGNENSLLDTTDDENFIAPKHADFSSNLVGSRRVVVLRGRTDSQKLSKSQKQDVLEFDHDNSKLSAADLDKQINQGILNKDFSDTMELMMTPQQKLNAGLISQNQFDSLVDLKESHTHPANPVEIDKFWDENLKIKKKRFSNEDFDKYKIRGFDIDQKIKQLFKVI
jgi:hypothetical protein